MNTKYIISLIIFLSVLSYGQVSIVSETNTKEYELNKPFSLNIGVEIEGNLHPQTPVKLPDLSKFEILGNASEMFSFIDEENGNLVRQIVYQLIIEPKQTGKIKIGSALVQINGKIYKSEPFDIIVKEKKKRETQTNRDVFLVMETQNNGSYENEGIRVIVKAYGRNYTHFRKLHQVKLPQNIGNIYPIHLNHQDIEQNTDEISSQVIASFLIFPDKSGIITIPPAFAKLENQQIKSNPLKIDTKPLPKNAPKSFGNAVGDFNLEIYTKHQNNEINQPIDVFVKLSGMGNLDNIELPKILQSNDYQIFNPKKNIKTKTKNENLHGEIVEHYILIPKKEGNIDILLEEFSFFNPKNKEYQHYQKSLTLDISPKSTEEEDIIKNTEHILKKVDLDLTTPTKTEQKSENNWLTTISIFSLLGGIIGIFMWVFRKKKVNNFPQKQEKTEKITTIAETEELLKQQISIGKDYYFRAMKNAIKQDNSTNFFELYEELHKSTEKQLFTNKKQSIHQALTETKNIDFANEYNDFRQKMEIEKYAPYQHNLEELYQNIYKFYSEIME